MKKLIMLLLLLPALLLFVPKGLHAQTTFTFSFKFQDPAYNPGPPPNHVYYVAVRIVGYGWTTAWVWQNNFSPSITTLIPGTLYNEQVVITIPDPSPPILAEYCQMELVVYRDNLNTRIVGWSQWMSYDLNLNAGSIDPGSF